LEIPPLSTVEDIKKKYKKKAKLLHSDKGGRDEDMAKLNWAYEVLINYIKNYKFTFSEEEILRQYPEEFLKKFKV
jgi:DnaJ-class molecular chaperone